MLTISRKFFFHWRYREFWQLSYRRIAQGFEATIPGYFIRVGHNCYPCRVCLQRENILTWDDANPGAAICPECCEHEEYRYERGDRDYFCTECGQSAPYDAYVYEPREGDVGISFASAREPGEPLGTPISELSGRAVGPMHPDYPKYEAWKRIAQSWGFD